jgi:type III pantothenate kinase
MVMVLLVDAGNSRLKWSELDASGDTSAQQALAYGERPALEAFLDLLDAYPAVGYITLVHVLTQLFADSVQEACAQRGIHLNSVRSVARAYGITNGYQQPAALGADRFVGLVAAQHCAAGKASIVIDCGTAITVDALQQDGRHLGGLILPGLQLSADALIARAQGRLSLSFEQPTIVADSTGRAIGSGCLFGVIGAIEGICARMQQTLSAPVVRILTGGDAEYLRAWLQGDYVLQPDLLMRGLAYITEQEACTSC